MPEYNKNGCNVDFLLLPSHEVDTCKLTFHLPRDAEGSVLTQRSRIVLVSDECKLPGIYFIKVEETVPNSQEPCCRIQIISEECKLQYFERTWVSIAGSSIILYSGDVDSTFTIKTDVKTEDSVIYIDCPNGVQIKETAIPKIKTETSVICVQIPVTSEPVVKKPEPNDLPTKLVIKTTDINGPILPWRPAESARNQFIDIIISPSYGNITKHNILNDIPHVVNMDKGVSTNICWADLYSPYHTVDIPWRDYPKKLNAYIDIPWVMMEAWYSKEAICSVAWGRFKYYDFEKYFHWNYPAFKDKEVEYIGWGIFPTKELHYIIPWNVPPAKDTEYHMPWGPIDLSDICCETYTPPPSCYPIVFNATELNVPYVCQGVVLSIGPIYSNSLTRYCQYQHHTTGNRDSLSIPPDVDKFRIRPRDEYDMINIVTVHILNDTTPIPVTSIDISTDKDSYLWSFSISMAKNDGSANFIEMLRPKIVAGEPAYTDIVIGVNYHYWVCRVDGYSESRSFGKDTWTITGRSPSMELGSPQNKKFTYTYAAEGNVSATGQSIIDQILQGTVMASKNVTLDDLGWRADFSRYGQNIHTGFDPSSGTDWGFNSGSITWQDCTQIEAIKVLTDSIGAFIITEPNSIGYGIENATSEQHKVLYVRPKYDYPPWMWYREWDVTKENCKMISTELAIEVGRTYELKADYNAVMVMGTMKVDSDTGQIEQAKGFPVVELFKKGIGPDFRIYAPDIVDEKLQTPRACAEAGRVTLCETGFWLKHTLKMYSLRFPTSTDNTIPPLCFPGDLIKVQEGNKRGGKEDEWYGDVESLQINVVITNNATHVAQTLGINEYIG